MSRPADDPRLDLLGLSREEWDRKVGPLLAAFGEPPYRSRQLEGWVFQRTPAGFEGMSDLPAGLRRRLEGEAVLHPLTLLEERVSSDGTRKYLWTRSRGTGTIESVLIPDEREGGRTRITYCISTQAGCPVKCTFCATGHGGFEGQLGPAEIVDQVIGIRGISGLPPTNIVYMGMGEPLLNFPATLASLAVLADPERLGLGSRRITVSTVGVPERIVELGRRFPQVKLALSLHAARDDLRTELIPINRKHPLAQVLEAVREHRRITGKMATFEYVLLRGVNDAERDAREIGEVLSGIPSRINLIEFNPFPGISYQRPSVSRLEEFRRSIQKGFPGPVTIRRSRGEDIHGACGQLTLATRGAAAP